MAFECGTHVDEEEIVSQGPIWRFEPGFVGQTIDEYTGLELPHPQVLEAKKEELEFMLKLKVWKVVPTGTAVEVTSVPPFTVWSVCSTRAMRRTWGLGVGFALQRRAGERPSRLKTPRLYLWPTHD